MTKKIPKLLFFLIAALMPLLVLIPAWNPAAAQLALKDNENSAGTLSAWFENYVRLNMPFRGLLLQINLNIVMAGGQREIMTQSYDYPLRQNGIFVGDDALMKNINPPVDEFVQENTTGIIEFAERMRASRVPTYVTLIPTSGAIMQQKLPPFAQSVMVNQKEFIEDTYSKLSGSTTTVDAYGALINRQNQYIYYRTEDNLTQTGGYFVYAAMLGRLGIGVPTLSQFSIDYADNQFYGNLYAESGYHNVSPDMIALFRYSPSNRSPREYLVTHTAAGTAKTYHTLFPEHMLNLGNKQAVYLGGLSAVTDIKTSPQSSVHVLVFGDKTALAYLPFLANNCGRVTFIDLSYEPEEFSGIDPRDYNKVLFAYGVESYMHTNNPAGAVGLLQEE